MRIDGESVKLVLMAGGRGERFWPRSTEALPKQFLCVDGDRSLLRRTFDRAAALVAPRSVYVVTNQQYAGLVRHELPEIPDQNLILEPVGRNTAPALGLAALRLEPDSVLVALPSDHHITGEGRFQAALLTAVETARKGFLVTIGIPPSRPETGYGYIQVGPALEEGRGLPVHRVARFVEKPDRASAERYLESGEYLWNAGILICQTELLRSEIARHLPEVHRLLEEIRQAAPAPGELPCQAAERFARMPTISVDHGILERSDRVAVVPGHFGWNDVGDWAALSRLLPLDEDGNAVQGDALLHNARRLVVHAGADRLVVAVGVEDLVIVDTPEALLVCARDQAQEVRRVARIGSALARAMKLLHRSRPPDEPGRRGGSPCHP